MEPLQLFETLTKGQEDEMYEISYKFNETFLRKIKFSFILYILRDILLPKVEESRQIVVDEKIRNGQVFIQRRVGGWALCFDGYQIVWIAHGQEFLVQEILSCTSFQKLKFIVCQDMQQLCISKVWLELH